MSQTAHVSSDHCPGYSPEEMMDAGGGVERAAGNPLPLGS